MSMKPLTIEKATEIARAMNHHNGCSLPLVTVEDVMQLHPIHVVSNDEEACTVYSIQRGSITILCREYPNGQFHSQLHYW